MEDGGSPEDKNRLTLLLEELQTAFKPLGLIVTAAISANKNRIESAYNVTALYEVLDFVHVMTYDYRGVWNGQTGHHSPVYGSR